MTIPTLLQITEAERRRQADLARMAELDRAIKLNLPDPPEPKTPRVPYGTRHQAEMDRVAARMRERAQRPWSTARPRFVGDLLRAACEQHGCRPVDVLSGSQLRCVSKARWQVVRALAEDSRGISMTQIGKWLNMSQTSVWHVLRRDSGPYGGAEKIAGSGGGR